MRRRTALPLLPVAFLLWMLPPVAIQASPLDQRECPVILQNYRTLISRLSSLEGQNPSMQPSQSPRFSVACMGEERFRARDAEQLRLTELFTSNIFYEERRLLRDIRSAGTRAQECNGIAAEVLAADLRRASEILNRRVQAMSVSISGLADEERMDRSHALIAAMQSIINEGNLDAMGRENILSQARAIARKHIDDLLRKIRDAHDLRIPASAADGLFTSGPLADLFDSDEEEGYRSKIRGSYVFGLSIANEVEMRTPRSLTLLTAGGSGFRVDHARINGDRNELRITMGYQSGEFTSGEAHGVLVLPLQFESVVRLELHACNAKPSMKVILGRLGSEMERFRLSEGHGESLRELPGMLGAWDRAALSQIRQATGAYELDVPLEPSNPIIAQGAQIGVIDGENGRISARLSVSITHEPASD